MNSTPNKSIACEVTNCVYNCGCADGKFCTRSGIQVGTHEVNPTKCECTDCLSFELK